MSKRQEIRDKQRQSERLQRIIAVIGLVIFALAVVGIMVWSSLPQAVGTILDPTPLARPQVNFNGMGNPNAPVKIFEYADFQCPYCMHFIKDTEPQIVEVYVKTGKVYFEYHSFGSFIGAESARAAEAAYCAGDQAKFWEMHDILYTNQGAENSGALKDSRIKQLADHLKLDMTTFNACFDSGKYKSRVSQDGADAQKAGISSTPSFLVNGKLIKGAQTFATFQQEIEAALAGK